MANDEKINSLVETIAENVLIQYVDLVKEFERVERRQLLTEKVLESAERMRLDIGKVSPEGLVKRIYDYMFGYGILQELIEDDSISDIDITRFDHIMIKHRGIYRKSSLCFQDANKLMLYCKLIVIRNGGKLNENHCFDRVDDNQNLLRISASIPPRSVVGPTISIRKHRRQAYKLDELLEEKMLDLHSIDIIRKGIIEKENILICGKGGSGKTTLLRAILSEIPENRRFLVCESESELYPDNKNFLVEKIIQREFGRSTDLSELVRDGLSVSLDGYCIGEIVGEEAWEFIKAGMTDHTTFATIHANGIREVISRLKMLINNRVQNYGSLEIQSMITDSLDYIIYLSNFRVQEIGKWQHDEMSSLYNRNEANNEPS
jgi:pilus assembly protein CpaF